MAQYSKIKIVNLLQSRGFTAWLYKLGMANGKMLTYAAAYNFYDIQLKKGSTKAEAIKDTAIKFRIARRSMYNVLHEMQTIVDVPKDMEILVSKKT